MDLQSAPFHILALPFYSFSYFITIRKKATKAFSRKGLGVSVLQVRTRLFVENPLNPCHNEINISGTNCGKIEASS